MTETTSLSANVLDPGSLVGGRYEVVRAIGTGGMANIYLAHDRNQENSEVALKVLHKEFALDKSYVERFIREVKLTNGISHPNIARTFDIGTDDGMIYFTMEYIQGRSLEQLMEEKGFSVEEISHFVIEICKGLKVIHDLGIIHRDLKPGNVLVSDTGVIKLVDFGVARDKSSRLTQPNQKVGSICYIAPEVWLGKKLTSSVDFYGLGIMLYELLTGNVPFEDPLPGKMLTLHLEGKVIPPQEKNASIPRWLNDLVMKLLEKAPKDRPRSAQAIIDLVEWEAFRKDKTLGKLKVRENDPEVDSATTSAKITPSITSARGTENRARGKTYVFKLTATRMIEDVNSGRDASRPKRKATVVFTLPRRAAVVLEIEPPSRDVIFFGLFLGSLQILDGVLTSIGVQTWGVYAEGNPLLRTLMHWFGPQNAILGAKALAIILVVFTTIIAKKKKLFKDLIAGLSCIYLFAAIIPWVYILSIRYATYAP